MIIISLQSIDVYIVITSDMKSSVHYADLTSFQDGTDEWLEYKADLSK